MAILVNAGFSTVTQKLETLVVSLLITGPMSLKIKTGFGATEPMISVDTMGACN